MHNGGCSKKLPSVVTGPRTCPVPTADRMEDQSAVYPVMVDMARLSITESQAESASVAPMDLVPSETRFPPEIRIGPERSGYVYTLHFPSGVYLCERGSEWANAGDRLFLCKDTTSQPRP